MTPQIWQALALIAISAFTAGAVVFIFLPSRDVDTGMDKTRLEYLYERKEVVYDNLRDLNFEFKAGKFTQADYDGMRLGMEAEAARLLAEIETLESIPA
jgi:hypothetical protein